MGAMGSPLHEDREFMPPVEQVAALDRLRAPIPADRFGSDTR
jgi:hypothetical protein